MININHNITFFSYQSVIPDVSFFAAFFDLDLFSFFSEETDFFEISAASLGSPRLLDLTTIFPF